MGSDENGKATAGTWLGRHLASARLPCSHHIPAHGFLVLPKTQRTTCASNPQPACRLGWYPQQALKRILHPLKFTHHIETHPLRRIVDAWLSTQLAEGWEPPIQQFIRDSMPEIAQLDFSLAQRVGSTAATGEGAAA